MIQLIQSKQQRHFYLSGFIAFSLYACFFILFIFYIQTANVKKFDATYKNTVLELDVLIVDNSKSQKSQIQEVKTKSHEIVKKSKSRSAKQQNSVKSLFANVKDRSKKVVTKTVNNVVASEVSSRFRSKFEKQRKSDNISVSKLLNNVKASASVLPSVDSKNASDPYYSKIYELLAKRWQPMLIIDGLFAKVLVIISSNGEFDYKFLSRSGNDRFDKSLKFFLEEQKLLTFPTHNKGRFTQIEVLFKAKG